ncbi:MAG: trigger factor [Gammaproteobacteria bacterium]|nr:MAG: trigger factor [Gammaproteobacteria bacterium]RLA31279.1 MAG: trigger factor [Gammaproteobacteria bacterium]
MQVTVESTGTLERRMRVELPAERIEKEVNSRLKKVGMNARIKGFRPGKIPAKVVRQRYGVQVRQEVLSDLMGQSYRDAVIQENLSPVAQPKIEPEDSENTDGFAYVATFEVLPEVKLQGLDKIEVTVPEVEISDSDCDDMIDNLRKQKATWKTVEREAKDGDQVIVDFDGKLKGEPIEGGKGSEVAIVLGQGQMLPDFEEALFGIKAGDEKSFKVKFPKDYHATELAKKKVDFSIVVHRVEEQELPPVDDSLAEQYGVKEGGIEKLRADVVANMEREVEQKTRADIREQTMTGLLEANPVEVPVSMIHQEAHTMQHEAMRQLGVEDHAQAPPVTDFMDNAEKRVRLGLLIRHVVDDNNIQVDAERMKERVATICAGYENAEEMANTYMNDPKVMEQLEPMVIEEQAVEWLAKNGVEKKNKISFKDYMNPEAQK